MDVATFIDYSKLIIFALQLSACTINFLKVSVIGWQIYWTIISENKTFLARILIPKLKKMTVEFVKRRQHQQTFNHFKLSLNRSSI